MKNKNMIKRYKALLNQSGTNNPTAIELENSLGVVSLERNGQGNYSVRLTNAFPEDKTFVIIGSEGMSNDAARYCYRAGMDAVTVMTLDIYDSFNPKDDCLKNCS